jgi:hypothetical protein
MDGFYIINKHRIFPAIFFKRNNGFSNWLTMWCKSVVFFLMVGLMDGSDGEDQLTEFIFRIVNG